MLSFVQPGNQAGQIGEAGNAAAGVASSTGGAISGAVIGLAAWVVIVTVALIVLAVFSYRRWRSKSQTDTMFDNESMTNSEATSAASELDESLGAPRAHSNVIGEDMGPLEVHVEKFEPAPIHTNDSSEPNSNSTNSRL